MHFSSGLFGSLFTGSGKWTVNLTAKTFEFARAGERKKVIPYESIHSLESMQGLVWSEVAVDSGRGAIRFDGIGNGDAQQLIGHLEAKVSDALLKLIKPHRRSIANLSRSFKMLRARPRYLANRDISTWVDRQEAKNGTPARAILNAARNPLFPAHRLEGNLQTQIEMLMDVLQGQSSVIDKRNEAFIQEEMISHRDFFDSLSICG